MNRADPIGRSAGTLTDRTRGLLRDERVASRDGWLQAVHPVVKLLGIVALLVVTVTFETPSPPAAVLAVTIVLAALSRVSLAVHGLRTAVPTAIALLIVAPQAVLISGPTLLGPVSVPGGTYVATFALRVGASVSLLGLLLSTTRFTSLLSALRSLRAPRTAVTLLSITYRYLLVVFEELSRLVLARRSRRVRRATLGESWREAGSLLGTFLLRALDRGERVGRSARSRGGTSGRVYAHQHAIGFADAAFAFVVFGTGTAGVLLA
ncbi:Cobalt transport protein [Halorhabdus tiamatea SARL4B]|uniref:Cobalt ABC transporter, inner membrane subunit CbiQ n=1 Tax=Halorhabdus tiamatea SARL4B TaxID=1033806 RepID=F7PQM5_9EURY|nr:cobalt ECF transporter T component CbiQ [Halorhabdus tiamatea]ERJ04672.1 Cobalt transport protein [Halorhabdus tiamatea SARL4B]CCQ32318.1 cobalt ABC transporter, inner membrane subunit CbiQ [Halorhabdus tiamatea SARL4B]